jgi:hypothetical protein
LIEDIVIQSIIFRWAEQSLGLSVKFEQLDHQLVKSTKWPSVESNDQLCKLYVESHQLQSVILIGEIRRYSQTRLELIINEEICESLLLEAPLGHEHHLILRFADLVIALEV